MMMINTNLQSLIVQNNLTKSTNALNLAIERLTTGFKINHASDNAANYSISSKMSSQLSSYNTAMDNAEMGADMISTAEDILDNMTSETMRLRELCVQAQNGTYGQQSVDAMKAEAKSIVANISSQYESAEYNGIKLFDVYSDKIAELQKNSETPDTPIGLLSDISPKYNGFIDNPVTYTDEQIEAMLADSTMQKLSSIGTTTPISSGKYLISSAEELAQLAEMVNSGKVTGGEFVLGDDVDLSSWCAEHTNPDGTGGWNAIGTNSKTFQGTFDGNGHKVTGLYINKETEDYQGLFGCADSGSTIKNIRVVGEVRGENYVGGLAGYAGSITNSYATGNVSGTSGVGGLAGYAGSITNSYATGNVSGTGYYVGGLAGYAFDSIITNSYATGNVSGTRNVGGLAGYAGSITNSYATGNVSGTSNVGGLAGYADYSITNSYATGNVSGTQLVGGLAGYANYSITNSYATGNVSGTQLVGGLVGSIWNNITNSYATGNVSSTGSINGSSFTGGLVGRLLKTSGTVEYKNNASFGQVSAAVTAGSGSLFGGIVNTTNGTSFATITLKNQMTTNQLDAIGGTYKFSSSTYTPINEPENMENWNNNISKFSTEIQLQVGINGDSSSQITTQTNLNIGLINQLKSLDISKSSSIDFLDSFLNELSKKSTELGAASNRLESALESIQVSVNNLTSSRSTIKDADIAQVSSEYIRQQILQQASATLLTTANQSPSIALQLI